MSANPGNGVITIFFDGGEITQLAAGNILILTPSIAGNPLGVPGVSGSIDWACAGASSLTASSRGLPVLAGTLEARYSPTECK
jgi:type IV pilus assembly protein PilA